MQLFQDSINNCFLQPLTRSDLSPRLIIVWEEHWVIGTVTEKVVSDSH